MTEPTKPRLQSDGDFAGYLTPHQADAYFAEARKNSVVQTLARKVPLGITGEQIPIVTSKARAYWTAEGDRKKQSQGTVGVKGMSPHKITAIAVVSAEVVRANPANYIELFKADVAEAIGTQFDAAVLHGVESPFGAGQNFDAAAVGSVELGSNTYDDLVSSLKTMVAAKTLLGNRRKLTGFAFDSLIEPLFLSAKDNNGTPLFVADNLTETAETVRQGRVIGRPSTMAEGVATADDSSVVGYGADFTQMVWGSVGGLAFDVSTEATVTINGTLTSLWEHNLVAIRAEAEFGFLLNTDPATKADGTANPNAGKASIVKFTNTVQ